MLTEIRRNQKLKFSIKGNILNYVVYEDYRGYYYLDSIEYFDNNVIFRRLKIIDIFKFVTLIQMILF